MARTLTRLLLCAALVPISGGALHAAAADGYVVKVDGKVVYLDWGSPTGVQPGDRFSIYRTGAALKHPVTGEVLGHSEDELGSGAIEKVEEKFSVGHLIETKGEIRAGDRTRWLETSTAPTPVPPAVSAPSSAPAAAPGATASGPAPQEKWRSSPIKDSAAGIALGDLDGDGTREIILAFANRLEVFRVKDGTLESLGVYKDKKWGRWIAVEAGDLPGAGHDEIYATAFLDSQHRSRIVVLRWENGKLKTAGDLEGFARMVTRYNAPPMLLWQEMAGSREPHFVHPAQLVYKDGKYKAGDSVPARRLRDDQLFGLAFGDWDGDQKEDLALLENDHLRLFFNGAKWSGSDLYGGTKNDFAFDENSLASLSPRIESRGSTGPQLLIAPHNIAELGIRLTYLKIYKRSELVALRWNGLEMAPVWRLPIAGYLADYQITPSGASDPGTLWVLANAPGDKTVLVSYSLP